MRARQRPACGLQPPLPPPRTTTVFHVGKQELRRRSTICRITNTTEEVYKALGIPMPTGAEEEETVVNNTQGESCTHGRDDGTASDVLVAHA